MILNSMLCDHDLLLQQHERQIYLNEISILHNLPKILVYDIIIYPFSNKLCFYLFLI